MSRVKNLMVIEHKGIRVLTTQQLADVYETEPNNIQQNFLRNQERFIEGRDYYKLDGPELAEFKRVLTNSQEPSNRLVTNSDDPAIKFASVLILWTDRGANRHSKILDTDKAWQQFDLLEETYFKVKTEQAALPQMTPTQLIAAIAQQQAAQEQKCLISKPEPCKPNDGSNWSRTRSFSATITGVRASTLWWAAL